MICTYYFLSLVLANFLLTVIISTNHNTTPDFKETEEAILQDPEHVKALIKLVFEHPNMDIKVMNSMNF